MVCKDRAHLPRQYIPSLYGAYIGLIHVYICLAWFGIGLGNQPETFDRVAVRRIAIHDDNIRADPGDQVQQYPAMCVCGGMHDSVCNKTLFNPVNVKAVLYIFENSY